MYTVFIGTSSCVSGRPSSSKEETERECWISPTAVGSRKRKSSPTSSNSPRRSKLMGESENPQRTGKCNCGVMVFI